jgi:hypothetical protein
MGYGSFHQKYYLDDKLVAVGVIDVLPHCLSSVYAFYDPDLPELELGKYTALREIQWVQAAARISPRLRFYYMGFYIHTCRKMRYKADYSPSDVLCPVTGQWVSLASAVPRLTAAPYSLLAASAAWKDRIDRGEDPFAVPAFGPAQTSNALQPLADAKAMEEEAIEAEQAMFRARYEAIKQLLPAAGVFVGQGCAISNFLRLEKIEPERRQGIALAVVREILMRVGPAWGARVIYHLNV